MTDVDVRLAEWNPMPGLYDHRALPCARCERDQTPHVRLRGANAPFACVACLMPLLRAALLGELLPDPCTECKAYVIDPHGDMHRSVCQRCEHG